MKKNDILVGSAALFCPEKRVREILRVSDKR